MNMAFGFGMNVPDREFNSMAGLEVFTVLLLNIMSTFIDSLDMTNTMVHQVDFCRTNSHMAK